MRTPIPEQQQMDAGTAYLYRARVVLVRIAPGEVVVASFARNLERLAGLLRDAHALLRIAHGTEVLPVPITGTFLRSERRTAWALGDVGIDVDLEPLPGLDYGALLLDAEASSPEDHGPPWACGLHRERIATHRADRLAWPRRPRP